MLRGDGGSDLATEEIRGYAGVLTEPHHVEGGLPRLWYHGIRITSVALYLHGQTCLRAMEKWCDCWVGPCMPKRDSLFGLTQQWEVLGMGGRRSDLPGTGVQLVKCNTDVCVEGGGGGLEYDCANIQPSRVKWIEVRQRVGEV